MTDSPAAHVGNKDGLFLVFCGKLRQGLVDRGGRGFFGGSIGDRELPGTAAIHHPFIPPEEDIAIAPGSCRSGPFLAKKRNEPTGLVKLPGAAHIFIPGCI